MAKYTVEHSCGHVVVHQLVGKSSERDRRIEWLETVPCLECTRKAQQEARDKENAVSAQTNTEKKRIPLIGSEKQVAWAETIRVSILDKVDNFLAMLPDKEDQLEKQGYKKVRVEKVFFFLQGQDSASWWIDHRSENIQTLIQSLYDNLPADAGVDKKILVAAEAEATIRPEPAKTDTVAEIRILEDAVEIHFPEKREDFRELVRFKLNYTWTDTCWKRRIKPINGTPAERAAEAGNALLAAGFPIRIFDEKARTAAINADFPPEKTRWIMGKTAGEYTGWLVISWKEKNDSLYKAARNLPGSRWHRPDVVVPAEQFDQVLDFSEIHGFSISEYAMGLIETARATRDAALVATPEKPKQEDRPKDGRPDLDPSTAGDIDADLLDD